MTQIFEPTTDFLETDLRDGILTIRLNRPDALNAFRPEMLIGIAEFAEAATTSEDVAVLVLEGRWQGVLRRSGSEGSAERDPASRQDRQRLRRLGPARLPSPAEVLPPGDR